MRQKIQQMIEDGFSARRIAKECGYSNEEVKNIIKQSNWALLKENFQEKDINRICYLYKMGVSAKQLGLKFSIDKRRIQRWAKERNFLRNRNDSHRITYFNQNYFDTIDNADKAYWLGFFYADAYNGLSTNTINVSLNGNDSDHLKKLAKSLGLTEKNVKRKLTAAGYDVCTLQIYSKHICNKLVKLGCPPAKSFIIDYPKWLPNDLHNHFIRGLFDGDGCITRRSKNKEWKWSLVSTKECSEFIQAIILKEINCKLSLNYISKTNNNTYELETSGNEKIMTIMNWLYYDSHDLIRLDRKYQKFLELNKQQKSRKINRAQYNISENHKDNIILDIRNGMKSSEIARKHNVSAVTVGRIKKIDEAKYDSIVVINGRRITAKLLRSLEEHEREALIEPIFEYFKNIGWMFPRPENQKLLQSYNKLCNKNFDMNNNELFNNSSLATDICKTFCHSFYTSTEPGGRNMVDVWNDDELLKQIIRNRLGLGWKKNPEFFNISFRMILQGMRSMRLVPQITIFKPTIAKYICLKYSEPNDLVGDYSAGFGGRMLGAMSCGRRYMGIDPLTIPELEKMRSFFNFQQCSLIHNGSEEFKGPKHSVDLFWSSPPYYNQEVYSNDISQAYNRGKQYFYEMYWPKTLENAKHMLKPGKWFGLNVKDDRMLEITKEKFGPVVEYVNLRTVRSHLAKKAGIEKLEYVYMFKNNN